MKQPKQFSILAVVLYFGFFHVATAGEPDRVARSLYPLQALTCPEHLLRGCCGHYCPKPLPYVPCFSYECGKDDYCCKPCPCVPLYHGDCSPDCYCRKPCPELCRPIAADYFTCAGWSAPCANPGACDSKTPLATTPAASAHRPTEGAGVSLFFPTSD
jgi:hypothetical protein